MGRFQRSSASLETPSWHRTQAFSSQAWEPLSSSSAQVSSAGSSALKEPTEYQKRPSAEPPSPARVIPPSTAEAAQPPQASQQIATAPERPLPPPLQPVKAAQAPVERQVENVDTRKAEAEQRERRKRYAERKAKRQAERAKRQQQMPGEHQEAPIMAFGGDEPPRSGGFAFFGN
jgi:hypothetical protein